MFGGLNQLGGENVRKFEDFSKMSSFEYSSFLVELWEKMDIFGNLRTVAYVSKWTEIQNGQNESQNGLNQLRNRRFGMSQK